VRKEAIETWYRSFKFEWLALVALEDSKRKACSLQEGQAQEMKSMQKHKALHCTGVCWLSQPGLFSPLSINGSILVFTGDWNRGGWQQVSKAGVWFLLLLLSPTWPL